MKSPHSRYELLRRAFSTLPAEIGPFKLRPLSAGSFELLGALKNPLVFGEGHSKLTIPVLLAAISEYIWIHTADLDRVVAIEGRESLPAAEIRSLGMQIELGESLAFTATFTEAALRMAAAMTEPDEDDDEPGKPEKLRTGSPVSHSPAEPPETPSASDISSGSLPSSGPSPISTPPMSPPDHESDGCTPLMTLPPMPPTTPPA